MSDVYNCLEAVAALPGKNDKRAAIASVIGTSYEAVLKEVVHRTYSPFITYDLKKFNEHRGEHKGITKLVDSFHLLDDLSSRAVTGNAAIDQVEHMCECLSREDAIVFARIIRGDLRCGASAGSFNTVWHGLVYEHPYQRCTSFSAKALSRITLPCESEIKMDGMYNDIIVTDEVVYRSRQGLVQGFNTELVDSFLSETWVYDGGYVLMGEALVIGDDSKYLSRKVGNGILNSGDYDVNKVAFVLWDCVPYDDFVAGRSFIPRSERMMKLDVLCRYARRLRPDAGQWLG